MRALWFTAKEIGWCFLAVVTALTVPCLAGWAAGGFSPIPDRIDPGYQMPLAVQLASSGAFFAILVGFVVWRTLKLTKG